MSDYVLYSDGGAQLNVSGGCGCIVEDCSSGKRIHLTAFIGEATNNEAEIFASLLGFAYLQRTLDGASGVTLRWVCDSEYVLKSATQYIHNWKRNGWQTAGKKPVKNQGLWRAYLELSTGLEITPEHVRGHTGHPENEACDSASNWIREWGVDEVLQGGQGVAVEIDGEQWFAFDGIETISALRAMEPGEKAIFAVSELVSALQGDAGEAPTPREKDPDIEPACEKLKGLVTEFAASPSMAVRKISKELQRVVKKFDC